MQGILQISAPCSFVEITSRIVVNNIIILRELMTHELKIHNRYNLV